MSEIGCGTVRDRLPDQADGRLSVEEARSVEVHLASCRACGTEAETIRTLRAGRPDVPPGLHERVRAAARAELGRRSASETATPTGSPRPARRWEFPRWSLAAAAVAILALGSSFFLIDGPESESEDPFRTAFETAPSTWLSDDAVVAGAPVLDDLSDDALASLLEELGG